mmetsp:Transcript_10994/g.24537  ORF Transcript_10994/g.24537 Transcript_10994/m.24537 type:complete len:272 (-) Transcript_10994:185-1000(-)
MGNCACKESSEDAVAIVPGSIRPDVSKSGKNGNKIDTRVAISTARPNNHDEDDDQTRPLTPGSLLSSSSRSGSPSSSSSPNDSNKNKHHFWPTLPHNHLYVSDPARTGPSPMMAADDDVPDLVDDVHNNVPVTTMIQHYTQLEQLGQTEPSSTHFKQKQLQQLALLEQQQQQQAEEEEKERDESQLRNGDEETESLPPHPIVSNLVSSTLETTTVESSPKGSEPSSPTTNNNKPVVLLQRAPTHLETIPPNAVKSMVQSWTSRSLAGQEEE